METALIKSGRLLIDTGLSIYIFIVMLRFVFQTARVDFYNPIARFTVKATDPLLRPLRRMIPGFMGLDMAAVFLILVLEVIKHTALCLLLAKTIAPITLLTIWSFHGVLGCLIKIYFYSIIAMVLFSWLAVFGIIGNPYGNPFYTLLLQLLDPLLRPAQRILPPMGGLDLSPILVILFLTIASYFVDVIPSAPWDRGGALL